MKLENEINIMFGLMPESNFNSDIRKFLNDSKKQDSIIESVKKISANFIFPDLEKYARMYIKQLMFSNILKSENSTKRVKDHYKECFNLLEYCEAIKESQIDSITFNTKSGKTLKLKDEAMTKKIMKLLKLHYLTPEYIEAVKKIGFPGSSPKVTRYNKEFITGLFKLFKHLQTHNPELSNNDLYNFLREFIIILGFDFEAAYPNSVGDSEPFKSYFSELK